MNNAYFSLIGAFLLMLFILTPATQSWGEPPGIGLKGTLNGANSLQRYWVDNVQHGTSLGHMYYSTNRLGKTLYGYGYGHDRRYKKYDRHDTYAYRYGHGLRQKEYHGGRFGYLGRDKHHNTYNYFYRGRHKPHSLYNQGFGSMDRGYGYLR